MGQMNIAEVVQLLTGGGIRAEAAFPAERITRITEPVAAVSLADMDQEKGTVTVLVEILAPKESGGYACQQKAVSVCAVLADAGAVCRQGACAFVGKSNLFRVQVKAEFLNALPYTVVTGSMALQYVCGFSAEQERSSTEVSLEDTPWEFTVEEFFPWGVWNTLEADEPFEMDVNCMGNIERFESCTWTSRQRITERTGIRQIRKGKAEGRILTAE